MSAADSLLPCTTLADVAGVDEAGRGPLAGPVTAAAVLLNPLAPIAGLRDSKRLSAPARDELAAAIRDQCLAWCVAHASVAEIDRLNILNATMLAMQRAVQGLSRVPEVCLIDGNRCPSLSVPSVALVKGDDRVAAISAASILAKTSRDRLMVDLSERFPGYGFHAHKGYATAAHRERLRTLGPSPAHRRSFAPVREAESLAGEPQTDKARSARAQTPALE